MRFPGLKSRKSSSHGAPAQPNVTSTSSDDTLINGDKLATSSSSNNNSLLSLSKWRSNASSVDEHGVLRVDDAAVGSSAPSTGKRSFFGRRKSHTGSLSAGAQNTLDDAERSVPPRLHATVSSSANGGGHPLRQHTLPVELQGSTPPKSKRPGLSLPKRGFSTADILHSNGDSAPRKSTELASYQASSSLGPASEATDFGPAARSSSDSFQLRSFRSVTSIREEPTLSSLVNEELSYSPLSTRPSSPVTAPVSSIGVTSYFEARPRSPSGSARTPNTPGASVPVSRFREAKSAKSSPSLNGNGSQATVQAKSTGLKLDLPPKISLDYAIRPSLDNSQPDKELLDKDSSLTALTELNSRATSASPSKESYTTAIQTATASPPRLASPALIQRSASPSLYASEERPHSPAIHPLARHPDAGLPLPPVPVDPEHQQRQHRRTQSNQSISSLSASLGSWLNNTTSGFGITFSADDVQKAFAERTAALRSRTPSVKDGIHIGSASPDRSISQQPSLIQAEEEIIASPVVSGPTEEELAVLLGGKILPPPPSATDDEFQLQPAILPSPKTPLSRASSFSNLGFGSNLFSSALAKVAKPARDDDEDSEDSRDTPLPKIVTTNHVESKKKSSRASHAFNNSDSSSDESSDNNNSNDSEIRAKKREQSLVFPPPRPASEADRQRIYKAALTPPTMTPQGSSSDLRAYMQPVPPTAALTSANVSVLNNEDDDDEDIPLSTLKIRAQSEVGLSSISSRPSQSLNGNRSTTGGSSVGSASRGTANESSRRITLNPSSWNFASSKSTSMTRSLSAFSVISNVDATSSRQLQTRSASSHAIHTMSSSIDRPEGVSLSSLIELEKARLQFNFPTIQKKASTSSSKPSESSDGSFPSTPSDTKSASNRVKRASTLFPGNVTYLSPIGDRSSPKKANKKAVPASQNGTTDIRGEMSRHSKTLSVPLAPTNNTEGTLSSATRDRHRQEARRSGMLPVQSIAHKPFVQNVNASVATGSSLSPQALQGLPPPPGVDPTLYASLPADQKLNLQIRAQQLMNVMQTMAMQAQNGGLAPTSQFLPFALPNGVGAYTHEQLPAQMQMPMMGSSIPAFPPFPNFFGMPAGFPTPMLPHNGNLTDMHRYTSRAAPSAIGQPTLFQQAGFSEDNSKEASSSPSLQNRRRSQ